MQINVSSFHPLNVTDSCAVWNVLSSELLFQSAIAARCSFCCTSYVEYECLYKRRSENSPADTAVQEKFRKVKLAGHLTVHALDIADLQEVDLLQNRQRLSMGEISSIAFANKTGQSVLTDDQKARKLARTMLSSDRVQTTPHLLGWLFFTGALENGHKETIILQHRQSGRPLEKYFLEVCSEAERCRTLLK